MTTNENKESGWELSRPVRSTQITGVVKGCGSIVVDAVYDGWRPRDKADIFDAFHDAEWHRLGGITEDDALLQRAIEYFYCEAWWLRLSAIRDMYPKADLALDWSRPTDAYVYELNFEKDGQHYTHRIDLLNYEQDCLQPDEVSVADTILLQLAALGSNRGLDMLDRLLITPELCGVPFIYATATSIIASRALLSPSTHQDDLFGLIGQLVRPYSGESDAQVDSIVCSEAGDTYILEAPRPVRVIIAPETMPIQAILSSVAD